MIDVATYSNSKTKLFIPSVHSFLLNVVIIIIISFQLLFRFIKRPITAYQLPRLILVAIVSAVIDPKMISIMSSQNAYGTLDYFGVLLWRDKLYR